MEGHRAGEAELFVPSPPAGAGTVVAVFPHCDDFPLFAGGTIAAFAREGWPVYLIRTTNDEKDSYGLTIGETVAANEADFREMGTALEAKEVFDRELDVFVREALGLPEETEQETEYRLRAKAIREDNELGEEE